MSLGNLTECVISYKIALISSTSCARSITITESSILISPRITCYAMLSIACRDVGQNCDCVVSGDTEEELMKNAAEHAVKDHGYKQEDIMTPEMQKKIKSHVRRV